MNPPIRAVLSQTKRRIDPPNQAEGCAAHTSIKSLSRPPRQVGGYPWSGRAGTLDRAI